MKRDDASYELTRVGAHRAGAPVADHVVGEVRVEAHARRQRQRHVGEGAHYKARDQRRRRRRCHQVAAHFLLRVECQQNSK